MCHYLILLDVSLGICDWWCVIFYFGSFSDVSISGWESNKKISKEPSREDKLTTPYQYPPYHNYWMFSGEVIPGDIMFL